MSRKLTRLVLAASVAAGFTVAPMLAANAAERTVAVKDDKFDEGRPEFHIEKGDTVRWEVQNGKHTVTPDDPANWPTDKPSGELEQGKVYAVIFPKGGLYAYHCDLHPQMTGVINVKDLTPSSSSSSTTTTTAPPTTTTTRAIVPGPTTTTTSAPASSAGTKPPGSASPAPTTTSTKPSKDKKKDDKKEEETTTTTAPPPPAGPVDIPDEAIIPVLPGSQTGTTTQNGIEAPTSTPEGEAIALLKTNKGGGKAKKLLVASGLGLGVLGLGAAGYKWANRPSRYFPA